MNSFLNKQQNIPIVEVEQWGTGDILKDKNKVLITLLIKSTVLFAIPLDVSINLDTSIPTSWIKGETTGAQVAISTNTVSNTNLVGYVAICSL